MVSGEVLSGNRVEMRKCSLSLVKLGVIGSSTVASAPSCDTANYPETGESPH